MHTSAESTVKMTSLSDSIVQIDKHSNLHARSSGGPSFPRNRKSGRHLASHPQAQDPER